jgi:hypothetical protein
MSWSLCGMHCKSIIPRFSLLSEVKPALALFEMRGGGGARSMRAGWMTPKPSSL